MSKIDFNLIGNCMSFRSHLIKHMANGDAERVKDYLCAAYDTFNPENIFDHPCWEDIQKAINFLKNSGWKVGVVEWKTIGIQFACISPDERYFHSKYDHGA